METWSSLRREIFAEFLGCTFMTLFSCGVAMSTTQYNQPGTAQISTAFGFGLSYTVLFFALGHVSGAHLNLAVSVGLWAKSLSVKRSQNQRDNQREVSGRRCLLYMLAQVAGSCCGILLLAGVEPSGSNWERACFGASWIPSDSNINPFQGLLVQILCGFFLLLIFNSAIDAKFAHQASVPICIGFTIFVVTLFGFPLTRAGLNPTIAFAAAIAASGSDYCRPLVWSTHWIFWVGPILGAVLASLCYEHILKHPIKMEVDTPEPQADFRGRHQADVDEESLTVHRRVPINTNDPLGSMGRQAVGLQSKLERS